MIKDNPESKAVDPKRQLNPELKASCITNQSDKPQDNKPDILNAPFTSFEEVRSRRQTAQSEYMRNQIIKSVFETKGEKERKKKSRGLF